MRVHAIQTGSVRLKRAWPQGRGHGTARQLHAIFDAGWTDPLPIYAWVIEHPEGLIVVDTGETAGAARPGYFPWWHPAFRFAVRETLTPEDEIGPQLRRLGLAPEDARWVVLTHLHTDHAGGLHHFPNATILVARGISARAGARGPAARLCAAALAGVVRSHAARLPAPAGRPIPRQPRAHPGG